MLLRRALYIFTFFDGQVLYIHRKERVQVGGELSRYDNLYTSNHLYIHFIK